MAKRVIFLLILGVLVLLASAMPFADFARGNPMTPPPPPPPINNVYIRSDGSIEPASAPITRSGDVYAFSGNLLNSTLEVQRDNIILDGAGFTLEGHSPYEGLDLSDRNNVTVENVAFNQSREGIILYHSSNCLIVKNFFAINNFGFMSIQIDGGQNNTVKQNQFLGTFDSDDVQLFSTTQNTVSDNFMSNGSCGVNIERDSSDNLVSANNITGKSTAAIEISRSRGNTFFQNLIENNRVCVSINNAMLDIFVTQGFTVNAFNQNCFINNEANINTIQYPADLPLPPTAKSFVMNCTFEYNFWSDYHGEDNNRDGIGDNPYVIENATVDRFPLMAASEIYNILHDNSQSGNNSSASTVTLPLQTTFVAASIATAAIIVVCSAVYRHKIRRLVRSFSIRLTAERLKTTE
jgi:parallel beta-helix repeat protein